MFKCVIWNVYMCIYNCECIYMNVEYIILSYWSLLLVAAAATAKSLQLRPTLWPHRRQPARLPRPWDSPGKNTGVGRHFRLQCMKVKSESEVAQSCTTLRDPMVYSLPGSSVHGIFQARVLEWGAIAFSILLVKYIFIKYMLPWWLRW